MSKEFILNTQSFGQPSDACDTLIIELSSAHIYFCELSAEKNQPFYTSVYPLESINKINLSEQLIQAIKHFQFSKKNYKAIFINYFCKQFTLCPTQYFETENARTLLEFNTGSIADKLVLIDDINSDIKLIYAIDELLKSVLDKLFPHHQLKHSLTVLSKLMLNADELVRETILVSLHSNYIEVIVKIENKLILVNQYACKTTEDILYYILFLLEQFHLNTLSATITLVGNIDSQSFVVTSLKKYIKNVRLGVGHKSINWSQLKGMPQHFNYSLLNRLFCE